MSDPKQDLAEKAHTCLTSEGSPVCAGCRAEREFLPQVTATECERTASCAPGDHTYTWPCVRAVYPPGQTPPNQTPEATR